MSQTITNLHDRLYTCNGARERNRRIRQMRKIAMKNPKFYKAANLRIWREANT